MMTLSYVQNALEQIRADLVEIGVLTDPVSSAFSGPSFDSELLRNANDMRLASTIEHAMEVVDDFKKQVPTALQDQRAASADGLD